MSCLNEGRIQAVADGEATGAEVEHVQSCASCRGRVTETQSEMREFAREMAAISVPPALSVVEGPLRMPRGSAGATTLRRQPPVRQQPAWIFAAAAAAAVILALFVVFPSFDSRGRVNASEILNRSLATLSGSGVELLKYQLSINAPRIAPSETGEFLIEQLIDHDTGRWRFTRFAADGSLLSGIAEDAGSNKREVFIRDAGRSFRFSFQLSAGDQMPLWDLQRRYAEAFIRLVQASGARADLITNANGEQQYVIELPDAAGAAASPIFDLERARLVIDGQDFHVVEFSAAGSAVGDQVTIGYRLIERDVWASAPADVTFELPRDAGAIELRGEATPHIPNDVFQLLLRAVRP
jgi:hypothetical protein